MSDTLTLVVSGHEFTFFKPGATWEIGQHPNFYMGDALSPLVCGHTKVAPHVLKKLSREDKRTLGFAVSKFIGNGSINPEAPQFHYLGVESLSQLDIVPYECCVVDGIVMQFAHCQEDATLVMGFHALEHERGDVWTETILSDVISHSTFYPDVGFNRADGFNVYVMHYGYAATMHGSGPILQAEDFVVWLSREFAADKLNLGLRRVPYRMRWLETSIPNKIHDGMLI